VVLVLVLVVLVLVVPRSYSSLTTQKIRQLVIRV